MINKLYLQNDAIQNNIANVDTPGYKRKTAVFDGSFAAALCEARQTGAFSAAALTPHERVYDVGSYRLDANNVSIDYEMAEMYTNSVKYETMAGSVINNYKRLNMVLNGS